MNAYCGIAEPDGPRCTTAPKWASRDADILIPRRRARVVEEQLDEEMLLVNPVNGQLHRLNATASDVWNACDGRATIRMVAERLTDAYEVGFDDAQDHVEQLVAWFAESGLLETRATHD